jgi:ribosome-binding protein aMBF1 (putative translation factor)
MSSVFIKYFLLDTQKFIWEKQAMKTNNSKYGRRVSAIRHFLGMTQSQLAGELELTPNTVSNYERGISVPTVDVWEKLHAMAPEMFMFNEW